MTTTTGIDGWAGKSGKVSAGMEIPVLENYDPAHEYVLEFMDGEFRPQVTKVFQGVSKVIDEFRTVWQVEGTNVKVWNSFTYSWNMKSNLVVFIQRLGFFVKEGDEHRLGDFFVPHMRIRCRLKAQVNKEGEAQFYNIDINSLRSYNSAPPAAAPAPQPDRTQEIKSLLSKYNEPNSALAVFKQVYTQLDENVFWLYWNQVLAEKYPGKPAPAGAK
jgi:hypothetical protein